MKNDGIKIDAAAAGPALPLLALDEIEAAAVANAMMLDEGGIDRCTAAAASMALLFVGASQEQMLQELAAVRERMTTKLAEIYSDEIATLIAETFVATVAKCKVEIEKVAVGNSEAIQ